MSIELIHNENKLIIYIKNQEPIELSDFANSMTALSNEYQAEFGKDHRLYIHEVRSGSICATLVAGVAVTLPMFEHANSIIEFGRNFMSILRYLRGEQSTKPELTQQTLNNINKFIEPIAKDGGSILNIEITGDNNMLVINSNDANAMQNRIKREQELLKIPVQGIHDNVVLYWKQTRQDTKKGYKGIIETISPKEIKVNFADNHIQSQMVQEHPYKHAYLVDVKVQTVHGKPALYTITQFHDVIDLDD